MRGSWQTSQRSMGASDWAQETPARRNFSDGYAYFEHCVGNQDLLKKARRIFRKKEIRLEDIFALAKRGDRKALAFWDDLGRQLGNVLVGVINVLNPRRVIIGGGVSNNIVFFGPSLRRVIRERAMPVHARMVRLVRAGLGDDAGIYGAAFLVKEESGE